MKLQQIFNKTVSEYNLFKQSDRLLVAVSGGVDSTVLANLCHTLGYQIGIVHVNFQLRMEESDMDAALVEALALQLEVPFYMLSENCAEYATEHGLTTQVAARNIRYQFFDSVIALYGYNHLLTAHHAGDNAETMLYTLAKGATMKALRGIPLQRNYIVRPLLYAPKAKIETYAKENNIQYRNDESNTSIKYRRNFIRHEIIPKFAEINPNLESTLADSSKLGASYLSLIEGFVKNDSLKFLEQRRISLNVWENQASRYAWLYEMIQPLGFNFNDVEDIWSAYESKEASGNMFLAKDNTLSINRHELVLLQESKDKKPITIKNLESANEVCSGRLTFERVDDFIPDQNSAFLDLEKIQFPLTLRLWRSGDRFRPLGMNGQSKKIKDYLTSQKLDRSTKPEIEVITSNEQIIWVVGYRVAHGYAADEETDLILKISLA